MDFQYFLYYLQWWQDMCTSLVLLLIQTSERMYQFVYLKSQATYLS